MTLVQLPDLVLQVIQADRDVLRVGQTCCRILLTLTSRGHFTTPRAAKKFGMIILRLILWLNSSLSAHHIFLLSWLFRVNQLTRVLFRSTLLTSATSTFFTATLTLPNHDVLIFILVTATLLLSSINSTFTSIIKIVVLLVKVYRILLFVMVVTTYLRLVKLYLVANFVNRLSFSSSTITNGSLLGTGWISTHGLRKKSPLLSVLHLVTRSRISSHSPIQ